MPQEQEKGVLRSSTPLESSYDLASVVSSLVPWLGGPASAVLGGFAAGLRMERVGEALSSVNARIKDLESKTSKDYVQTDEFRELLDRTLRQVALERNEEMRRVYAAFLAGDIESPAEPYDEKLRFLRILDQLQSDHILVLAAMMQPGEESSGISGSISETLMKRLPGISNARIADLDALLQDLKLVAHGGVTAMMSARRSKELSSYVTPLGRRLVGHIRGIPSPAIPPSDDLDVEETPSSNSASIAHNLHSMARIELERGNLAGARDSCERSLSLFQEIANDSGQEAEIWRAVANCMSTLAQIERALGNGDHAEDLLSQSNAIFSRLDGVIGRD